MDALTSRFDSAGLDYTLGTLVKAVPQDLRSLDIKSYNLIVMFNPSDVISLKENFPDYSQGDTRLMSFGKSVVPAMEEAGFTVNAKAPTPEAPSVGKAIELYLAENS